METTVFLSDDKVGLSEETIPRRLKPRRFCEAQVRPEGRTYLE
jgi:hypothetical protein